MARSDFPIDIVDMPDKPGRPILPGRRLPIPPDPITAPPVRTPWDKRGQPPTTPGRPPLNPPTNPPKPITEPPVRTPIDPPPVEGPGDPGPPTTPTTPPGTGGDFSKGQPYQDVTGATKYGQPSSFYGSDQDYDPYFGRNVGSTAGRGATNYDPLRIGTDAYTDPNADVWSMTGVNSVLAPGAKVRPRYGVVGGQGGYGYGMVGQDYSGPIANDARPLVKDLRKQRRQLNRTTKAINGGPGVVDGPGGFGGNAANNGGGSGVVNGPGGFGPAGGGMDWKGQPTQASGAGGGDGGAGQKWGAPPPAAGGNTTNPTFNTPSTQALDAALPGGGGGPGGGAPGGFYEAGVYDTPWGTLVQDSGGQGNVFRRLGANGADDGMRFHYDPRAAGTDGAGQKAGWKSMTIDAMRGYGDYNYANPYEHAAAAGARKTEWERSPSGFMQAKVGTGTYR